jgi:small lipoprotein (TIGR04454 family)
MKRFSVIILTMLILIFLVGCSTGCVSQAEYDRVVAEKEIQATYQTS